MKRILFMGTPEIACGILQCLVDNHYNVVGVVSQPDKKVGRKQILTPTPVKQVALSYGIPVLQPESVKDIYEDIKAMDIDCIVTCAYGQFLPTSIIELAKIKAINVHASLLPKYRGGAPIHKCIINGEKETGISIMEMVKKMDAGDVCHVKKVEILEEDTMGTLYQKLMKCGQEALLEVIDDVLNGTATFIPQDESQATIAPNVSKEEEKIDFTKDGMSIYNHIRGLIPAPVGYVYLEGKKMKFHEVSIEHKECKEESGTILGLKDESLMVSLKDKTLFIKMLQPEGKPKMAAKDYYNGQGKKIIGKKFE